MNERVVQEATLINSLQVRKVIFEALKESLYRKYCFVPQTLTEEDILYLQKEHSFFGGKLIPEFEQWLSVTRPAQ